MTSTIYSVDRVDLSLIKTEPPGLLICADGRVANPGWSSPALVRHIYVTLPADGVLGFDFVATPPAPGDQTTPVLTPIRADHLIPDVDLANFWGDGLPLAGVRCRAVANAKTTLLEEARPGMPGMCTISVAADGGAPSFAADIKPLFRDRDVAVMKAFGGFDLHDYDDVAAEADGILARLVHSDPNLLMPCDGAWPKADIDLFRAWIDAGKAP